MVLLTIHHDRLITELIQETLRLVRRSASQGREITEQTGFRLYFPFQNKLNLN